MSALLISSSFTSDQILDCFVQFLQNVFGFICIGYVNDFDKKGWQNAQFEYGTQSSQTVVNLTKSRENGGIVKA